MADGQWGGTQFRVGAAKPGTTQADPPILNFSHGGYQQVVYSSDPHSRAHSSARVVGGAVVSGCQRLPVDWVGVRG